MCECRYYGKCAGNCDGHGLVLGFGNETYDCDYFSQLPDVDALLALADEMDERGRFAETAGSDGKVSGWYLREYADRIREALGVNDD